MFLLIRSSEDFRDKLVNKVYRWLLSYKFEKYKRWIFKHIFKVFFQIFYYYFLSSKDLNEGLSKLRRWLENRIPYAGHWMQHVNFWKRRLNVRWLSFAFYGTMAEPFKNLEGFSPKTHTEIGYNVLSFSKLRPNLVSQYSIKCLEQCTVRKECRYEVTIRFDLDSKICFSI